MNVICPDNLGIINISNIPVHNKQQVTIKNLIVKCPVCQKGVQISGISNFDKDGKPFKVDVLKS
jgi:hypothetical protein